MPVNIQDKTPPVDALSGTGHDVTDESTLAAAEALGRVKIEVQNGGTVRVWLGIGAPAVVGSGKFVDPGAEWYEYTTDAVHTVHDDTGQTHRVAVQEWAA